MGILYKKILRFSLFSLVCYTFFLFVQVLILGENFKFSNLITFDKKPSYLKYKIDEVKNGEIKDVDILFLGSSHSEGGFDVRIFEKYGYKTFNLGSSAQTPIQTEVLLKRYLHKINPKLIIYDVFLGAFNKEGVEASIDLIRSDENNFDTFKLILKIKNVKLFNIFLYKFLNDRLKIIKNSDKKFIDNQYVYSGFVDYGNGKFIPNTDTVLLKKEIDINNYNSFIRNIGLFKKKNIPYLLIRLPETKYFNLSFVNSNEFDSIIRSNGAYYNFNHLIPLNDTIHFMDDNHLNSFGVKIVNEYLINRILK